MVRCAAGVWPSQDALQQVEAAGDMGVFARMMEGLVSGGGEAKVAMIDATYLKAHRTAWSLRAKKGATTSAGV